jgi:hypothetical protein
MTTNLELQQFSVSKTTKDAVAEARRIICLAQAELAVSMIPKVSSDGPM